MASYRKHSGKWEFRLRYKDPFTQKFREKSERGFETKKQAQLAADAFEKKILGGFEQTDVSLAAYLDTWIEEYKSGTVRKTTLDIHRYSITHIKGHFKELLLKDLKPDMYQRFLNQMSKTDLSRRTVEIIHTTMHNALQKAVTLGKVEKNPCVGAEIKGEDAVREIKYIPSEHIPALLQELRRYGYIYWMFFRVLLETGIRKGEGGALKRATDLMLDQRKIRIDETIDWTAKDDSKLFGGPKTANSSRSIAISEGLVKDLTAHFNWLDQNREAFGDAYRSDLDLVLCREDGSPIPKSSLFNAFSRCLQRVGLPSMPIHSTRHTYAVVMLEAGADMKFVQEQLGHGSIQITSDIYAHISSKIADANMEKYENYTKAKNIFE